MRTESSTLFPRPKFRLIAVACTALAALVPAEPATATASTCSYDSSDDRASFSVVTPPMITIFVTKGGEIKWRNTLTMEETDCGDATVTNTKVINITDYNTAAEGQITIDMSRPFGPGANPESVGVSEIEFQLDGNQGTNHLILSTSDGSDRVAFGEEGVNYNKDSDVDMTIDDFQSFILLGNDGNDVLTGGGGFGTGGPFGIGMSIHGGDGRDTLTGSPKQDNIGGSPGRDVVTGGGGADILFGDKGNDRVNGGRGGDELDGLGGDDTLRGQAGPDDLEGGNGTDDCVGGPGMDTIATCE